MKSQTQHIGNYSNVFDYSPFGAPLDGRAVENIFHQEEFTTDTITENYNNAESRKRSASEINVNKYENPEEYQ